MWENAKVDYMNGMKYKDIATKYNVSISTVKSWKVRYKWDRKGTRTKTEKVCVQNEKSTHTKEHGGKGNKNAVGHGAPPGNKNSVRHKPSVPIGNQNARTHGFYSKYIPVDEIDILVDAPGAGQLDTDLKLARYKLARLLQYQKDYRLTGTAVTGDGVAKFALQDDYYEGMIQKQIKLISELEFKIHRMQSDNEVDGNNVEIIDSLEAVDNADLAE